MSLITQTSVQKLQTALHAKAKESPNFRFYALYDKVYRTDVVTFAYERCKANGGAAGVDEQAFEDIEAYGAERWLDELAQQLKSRINRSRAVSVNTMIWAISCWPSPMTRAVASEQARIAYAEAQRLSPEIGD